MANGQSISPDASSDRSPAALAELDAAVRAIELPAEPIINDPRRMIEVLAAGYCELHAAGLIFRDWPAATVANFCPTALAILDANPPDLSALAMARLPLIRKMFRCEADAADTFELANQHPAAAKAIRCLTIAIHSALLGIVRVLTQTAAEVLKEDFPLVNTSELAAEIERRYLAVC